ncbi:MAG: NAD-dependent epimerase/dehydratase family protein, partial [Candidatus Hydrothermarchaeaceae archaeon]
MKYLVTGGAGFIGSHIIERLLEENEEVACLDSFDPYYDPESKHENITPFLKNENFELIRGDVTDEGIVEKAIKEADYVIHEAAQAGVRVSVENPFKSYEVNTTGTLNILRASLNSNVKKIVFASSSS